MLRTLCKPSVGHCSQDGAFVGHETDSSKAALRLIPIPRRLGGGEDESGVGCAAQMMPGPVRGERVYSGDWFLVNLCGSSARDTHKNACQCAIRSIHYRRLQL